MRSKAQRVSGTHFLVVTLSTHTKKLADALRRPLLHLSSESVIFLRLFKLQELHSKMRNGGGMP